MSKLYYDIPLEEQYNGPNGEYKEAKVNIPHFQQIKEWLPKEWDKCSIKTAFYGILKDKVQSCTMRCFQKKQDGQILSIARVTIEFIPGFRLTQERRQACWEQLDAQMSDGFGESYDHHEIPNGDGWEIWF